MAHTLDSVRFGARIFNRLAFLCGKREAGTRLKISARSGRLAVKWANAPLALYESMLFGDPRKDARALARAMEIIVREGEKAMGAAFAPAFTAEVERQLQVMGE